MVREKTMTQSREYDESIINTVREPLIVLDQDLRVVLVSRSFYAIFKVKPEETLGQHIYDLGNKQWDIPKLRELLETILPEKTTFDNYEVEHDFATIGRRIMLLNARQIIRGMGKERIILLAIEDITERKRTEEALRKSSEKTKLFAYSVSHDLKSPSVAIYGLTKRLQRSYAELLGEKGRTYCDQIVKAAEHISALVEQVNLYIATSTAPLVIESVKLKDILQMVREEFSAQIGVHQIRWSEPEHLPELNADRIAILRVFRNLVQNALKYGGDDLTEIRLDYRDGDGFYILSVSNDGTMIRQEHFENLFEPFQRYETARGVEGAGLGLAIVKELVEQHGGEVWVESEQEKWTNFYVSISKNL